MNSDAPQPRKRHRFLKWLAILFVIVVIPSSVWFVSQVVVYYHQIKSGDVRSVKDRRLQASISEHVANVTVTKEDLERLVPSGLAPELGAKDARVTVVEFVDYQCPFCQKTAQPLRNVMVAMGDKVRFIIRDFPILELHPTAKVSALAANCVLEQGQDAYWRFHDVVYADQTRQSPEDLRAKAQFAGAKPAEYDACVSEGRHQAKIEEDIRIGIRAGVQGTPTFFVNGVKFQGAMDEKELTLILNAFLDRLPK
ncbi:MAG TPA: DsbA family protein [Candidatus Methylomirabilis sp.]|nr:DsbA family protein [Candidatus Methylomirabilis sp.]